jgi:feruloyl-CoA synthase
VTRYRDAHVGGCLAAEVERRADGSVRLRSTEPLQPYPARLTDRLEHWSQVAPDRTFAAKRDAGGDWRRIGYREMRQRARSIGQALLDRGLDAERPLAILSDNDLEHLSLACGAMWAGVPYVSISPAYSLISQDFGKLRHILATATPGLIYAASPAYVRAIDAVVPRDVEALVGRSSFESTVLASAPTAALDAAHAATGPDTLVKLLFTSGSTLQPKGVVHTHRMLCANQQMLRQAMAFLADAPPVLVDWLPWNHTFGGNHNIGIALYNGGTLYIDDGKPTPAGIGETLRNLRELSPTVYFNVPKGFEQIAAALDRGDDALARSLFRDCQAFMFAGAGLSQAVWDRLDAHAERTVGARIRVLTGLGMTETAPSCTFAVGTDTRSGHIGLPVPGVEVKLAPMGEKSEIRFRGPNVMPGYWRAPELTAAAFDDDGFYRTGDAVRWVDARDPQRGLAFDGRLAEDFKLSTGTFVSVGPLRAKALALGAPLLQDSVVTGLDRDEVGLLIFPRVDECRRHAGLPDDTPDADTLRHPAVRAFFQALVDRLAAGATGSASRVARALVLDTPPSIDAGEVTDKGSINQRAVLRQRAARIDALYAGDEPATIRSSREETT